jgi:hypothetical protein
MGDHTGRWRLCGGLAFNATGQREILVSGDELAHGQMVDVVPAERLERAEKVIAGLRVSLRKMREEKETT